MKRKPGATNLAQLALAMGASILRQEFGFSEEQCLAWYEATAAKLSNLAGGTDALQERFRTEVTRSLTKPVTGSHP